MDLIKDDFATLQDGGVSVALGLTNVRKEIRHVAQTKDNVWVLAQNPARVKRCKDAIGTLQGKVYLNQKTLITMHSLVG